MPENDSEKDLKKVVEELAKHAGARVAEEYQNAFKNAIDSTGGMSPLILLRSAQHFNNPLFFYEGLISHAFAGEDGGGIGRETLNKLAQSFARKTARTNRCIAELAGIMEKVYASAESGDYQTVAKLLGVKYCQKDSNARNCVPNCNPPTDKINENQELSVAASL